MANVIVLSGGNSDEREVSLRSGAAVIKALQSSGHKVVNIDPADNFLRHKHTVQQADVVFPVLHGSGGEDGQIQKILETWHVPFVGSGSTSSSLCFDKWRYKQLALDNGFMVPRGELVNLDKFSSSRYTKQPFVLKPFDGGSSVDTLIVRGADKVDLEKVQELFSRHSEMLLEELIIGSEITIGILDNQVLQVVEIIPPTSGEFDYENKYNGASQELCPPKNIDQNAQKLAQEIALKIHKLCGCQDLSRSDFIIGASGQPYLLETNTIPGLTEQSLFPKAAAAAGLSMPEAMDRLVQLALRRQTGGA